MSLARHIGAVLLAAALGGGCASPARLYVNADADMDFYQKVIVLPFANLTQDRFAGERVTRVFTTELVMMNRFRIVDPGELRAILDRTGGLSAVDGSYDPKKLKDAASEVGATGIIRGGVTEYQMIRSGTNERPSLAFDVEMVDVGTGNVVWRASITKRAKSGVPIVGGGSPTLSRLSEEACREVVSDLEREAY
jgi:hypothetical protein